VNLKDASKTYLVFSILYYSGEKNMGEGIQKLEDLPGVGPITAQKLRAAGYSSIESIAVASAKELAETTGMGTEKAVELSIKAREILHISFQTAEDLLKRRKEIARLTTGSKALNSLLGGGASAS
jgi:DNA repair protein RadA